MDLNIHRLYGAGRVFMILLLSFLLAFTPLIGGITPVLAASGDDYVPEGGASALPLGTALSGTASLLASMFGASLSAGTETDADPDAMMQEIFGFMGDVLQDERVTGALMEALGSVTLQEGDESGTGVNIIQETIIQVLEDGDLKSMLGDVIASYLLLEEGSPERELLSSLTTDIYNLIQDDEAGGFKDFLRTALNSFVNDERISSILGDVVSLVTERAGDVFSHLGGDTAFSVIPDLIDDWMTKLRDEVLGNNEIMSYFIYGVLENVQGIPEGFAEALANDPQYNLAMSTLLEIFWDSLIDPMFGDLGEAGVLDEYLGKLLTPECSNCQGHLEDVSPDPFCPVCGGGLWGALSGLPKMWMDSSIWSEYGNVTVNGNNITKIPATSAWDSGAISGATGGDISVDFTIIPATPSPFLDATIVGLSAVPGTNWAGTSDINYGWYIHSTDVNSNQRVRIREGGTDILVPIPGISMNNLGRFRVEYIGGTVKYIHNGIVHRTRAANHTGLLRIRALMHCFGRANTVVINPCFDCGSYNPTTCDFCAVKGTMGGVLSKLSADVDTVISAYAAGATGGGGGEPCQVESELGDWLMHWADILFTLFGNKEISGLLMDPLMAFFTEGAGKNHLDNMMEVLISNLGRSLELIADVEESPLGATVKDNITDPLQAILSGVQSSLLNIVIGIVGNINSDDDLSVVAAEFSYEMSKILFEIFPDYYDDPDAPVDPEEPGEIELSGDFIDGLFDSLTTLGRFTDPELQMGFNEIADDLAAYMVMDANCGNSNCDSFGEVCEDLSCPYYDMNNADKIGYEAANLLFGTVAGMVKGDGWAYRQKITVDSSKVDGRLDDFPVLVSLNSGNFEFAKAREDGFDIRFRWAGKDLYFERVTHDAANGKAEYWVNLPIVYPTGETSFYIYYGNPGAYDGAKGTQVWDRNFTGVWHKNNATSLTIGDSTINANTGTKQGTHSVEIEGKIDRAQSYNGINSKIDTIINKRPQNTFTYEAWVKAVNIHDIDPQATSGTTGITGQRYVFGAAHGGDNAVSGLSVGTNGISVYEHGDGYMPALAVYSGAVGTDWNHIAIRYEDKRPRIYLNGNLVRTGLTSPRPIVYAPHEIGGGSYGYHEGLIDEVRISDVARSPAWLKATYHSGNNTLLTYGSPGEVVCPGCVDPECRDCTINNLRDQLMGYDRLKAFYENLGGTKLEGQEDYPVKEDSGVTGIVWAVILELLDGEDFSGFFEELFGEEGNEESKGYIGELLDGTNGEGGVIDYGKRIGSAALAFVDRIFAPLLQLVYPRRYIYDYDEEQQTRMENMLSEDRIASSLRWILSPVDSFLTDADSKVVDFDEEGTNFPDFVVGRFLGDAPGEYDVLGKIATPARFSTIYEFVARTDAVGAVIEEDLKHLRAGYFEDDLTLETVPFYIKELFHRFDPGANPLPDNHIDIATSYNNMIDNMLNNMTEGCGTCVFCLDGNFIECAEAAIPLQQFLDQWSGGVEDVGGALERWGGILGDLNEEAPRPGRNYRAVDLTNVPAKMLGLIDGEEGMRDVFRAYIEAPVTPAANAIAESLQSQQVRTILRDLVADVADLAINGTGKVFSDIVANVNGEKDFIDDLVVELFTFGDFFTYFEQMLKEFLEDTSWIGQVHRTQQRVPNAPTSGDKGSNVLFGSIPTPNDWWNNRPIGDPAQQSWGLDYLVHLSYFYAARGRLTQNGPNIASTFGMDTTTTRGTKSLGGYVYYAADTTADGYNFGAGAFLWRLRVLKDTCDLDFYSSEMHQGAQQGVMLPLDVIMEWLKGETIFTGNNPNNPQVLQRPANILPQYLTNWARYHLAGSFAPDLVEVVLNIVNETLAYPGLDSAVEDWISAALFIDESDIGLVGHIGEILQKEYIGLAMPQEYLPFPADYEPNFAGLLKDVLVGLPGLDGKRELEMLDNIANVLRYDEAEYPDPREHPMVWLFQDHVGVTFSRLFEEIAAFLTERWGTSMIVGTGGAAQNLDFTTGLAIVPGTLRIVAQPPLKDWTHRQNVVIDSSKVDATLSNFPVLVKLTEDNFDFSLARKDGFDLRFSNLAGDVLYPYERVGFDPVAKKAELWVKIPSVSHSADTVISMHYGRRGAPDVSDSGAVWDATYAGVWHMEDSSSTTLTDSTSNNIHGTKEKAGTASVPQRVDGKVGGAQYFGNVFNGAELTNPDHQAYTGGGYINLGDHPALRMTGSQTIEMWVRPDDMRGRPPLYYKHHDRDGALAIMEYCIGNCCPQGDPANDWKVNCQLGKFSYYWGNGSGDVGYASYLPPYYSGGYQYAPAYQHFMTSQKYVDPANNAHYSAANELKWIHVTVVRDLGSGQLRFYKDGVLTDTVAAAFGAGAASNNSAFIGHDPAVGSFFSGEIDEFRISGQAHSGAWIKANYYSARNELLSYVPVVARDSGEESFRELADSIVQSSPTYNSIDYKTGDVAVSIKATATGANLVATWMPDLVADLDLKIDPNILRDGLHMDAAMHNMIYGHLSGGLADDLESVVSRYLKDETETINEEPVSRAFYASYMAEDIKFRFLNDILTAESGGVSLANYSSAIFTDHIRGFFIGPDSYGLGDKILSTLSGIVNSPTVFSSILETVFKSLKDIYSTFLRRITSFGGFALSGGGSPVMVQGSYEGYPPEEIMELIPSLGINSIFTAIGLPDSNALSGEVTVQDEEIRPAENKVDSAAAADAIIKALNRLDKNIIDEVIIEILGEQRFADNVEPFVKLIGDIATDPRISDIVGNSLTRNLGDGALTADFQKVWDNAFDFLYDRGDVFVNQNFTGATFPPADWERERVGGTGSNWTRNLLYSYSGGASACLNYSLDHSSAYLYTPWLNLSDPDISYEVTFREMGRRPQFYTNHSVWVQKSNDAYEFVAEIGDSSAVWREQTFDISDYAGQDIRVAFYYSGTNGDTWHIDDVKVNGVGLYESVNRTMVNVITDEETVNYVEGLVDAGIDIVGELLDDGVRGLALKSWPEDPADPSSEIEIVKILAKSFITAAREEFAGYSGFPGYQQQLYDMLTDNRFDGLLKYLTEALLEVGLETWVRFLEDDRFKAVLYDILIEVIEYAFGAAEEIANDNTLHLALASGVSKGIAASGPVPGQGFDFLQTAITDLANSLLTENNFLNNYLQAQFYAIEGEAPARAPQHRGGRWAIDEINPPWIFAGLIPDQNLVEEMTVSLAVIPPELVNQAFLQWLWWGGAEAPAGVIPLPQVAQNAAETISPDLTKALGTSFKLTQEHAADFLADNVDAIMAQTLGDLYEYFFDPVEGEYDGIVAAIRDDPRMDPEGAGESFYRDLTIDSSLVNERLRNFPVLVKLDSSNFDFSKAHPEGNDIRFRMAGKELDFEKAYYGNKTVFNANGTYTVPAGVTELDVLVVGGGGGGGGVIGGGGGAGGVVFKRVNVAPGQNIAVTVGAGGNGGFGWDTASQNGIPGGNSTFGALLTALGGGGGRHYGGATSATVVNGGSGGGGANGGAAGGTGTQPASASGGLGNNGGSGGDGNRGAGGGGAGTIGGNTLTGGGGAGGDGVEIWGNYYGGGGGGGLRSNQLGNPGIGGLGGGGNGTKTSVKAGNGLPNTGGGGGGAGYHANNTNLVGGNGGSGAVIVKPVNHIASMEGEFWVNIPTISPDADTTLTMYYGNPDKKTVFEDNFARWTGWYDYSNGAVVRSSNQAKVGGHSLRKTTNSDPHGGWKSLDEPVGRDYTLEGWIFSEEPRAGGGADRLAISDSNFNGYGFNIAAGTIAIEKRNAGTGATISASAAWTRPANTWYRFKFTANPDSTFTLTTYNEAGNQLATVTSNSDGSYSEFNRMVIHGGFSFYVDDLKLWTVEDKSNPREVWKDSYVGVWHKGNLTANTVADSSGNELTGTKLTDNQPSETEGYLGRAQDYNGSTGLVNMGNPAALRITGNQTIEMWLKPTSFVNRRNPLDKSYAGEGTITQEIAGTLNYFYGPRGNQGGSSGVDYQPFNNNSPLTAYQWAHVTLVRDLDNMMLRWYRDGFQTNQAVALFPAATASTQDFRIGDGYAGPTYHGIIDEVRISNKAHSPAWVKANYESMAGNLIDIGAEKEYHYYLPREFASSYINVLPFDAVGTFLDIPIYGETYGQNFDGAAFPPTGWSRAGGIGAFGADPAYAWDRDTGVRRGGSGASAAFRGTQTYLAHGNLFTLQSFTSPAFPPPGWSTERGINTTAAVPYNGPLNGWVKGYDGNLNPLNYGISAMGHDSITQADAYKNRNWRLHTFLYTPEFTYEAGGGLNRLIFDSMRGKNNGTLHRAAVGLAVYNEATGNFDRQAAMATYTPPTGWTQTIVSLPVVHQGKRVKVYFEGDASWTSSGSAVNTWEWRIDNVRVEGNAYQAARNVPTATMYSDWVTVGDEDDNYIMEFYESSLNRHRYFYHGFGLEDTGGTVLFEEQLGRAPVSPNWSRYRLDLEPFAGKTVRAFFEYRGAGADSWFIDDFSIRNIVGYEDKDETYDNLEEYGHIAVEEFPLQGIVDDFLDSSCGECAICLQALCGGTLNNPVGGCPGCLDCSNCENSTSNMFKEIFGGLTTDVLLLIMESDLYDTLLDSLKDFPIENVIGFLSDAYEPGHPRFDPANPGKTRGHDIGAVLTSLISGGISDFANYDFANYDKYGDGSGLSDKRKSMLGLIRGVIYDVIDILGEGSPGKVLVDLFVQILNNECGECEGCLVDDPCENTVLVDLLDRLLLMLGFVEESGGAEFIEPQVQGEDGYSVVYGDYAPNFFTQLIGGIYSRLVALFGGDLQESYDDPAEADVTLQSNPVNIPDQKLEKAIGYAIFAPDKELTEADLAKLYTLSASGRGITDLTGLEKAVNLKHLSLYDNQVTDLTPLAGLSNLESLHMSYNLIEDISSLFDKSQDPWPEKTNLTDLDLAFNKVANNEDNNKAFGAMPALKTLNLNENNITTLAPFGAMSNLEWLYLRENSNVTLNLNHISGLVNLQRLYLSGNPLTNFGALVNMPKMQRLRLADTEMINGDLAHLSVMGGTLQELNISGNFINNFGNLVPLTNLRTLKSSGGIGGAVNLASIAWGTLPLLETLELTDSGIDNAASLGNLVAIKELNLTDNLINDLGDGNGWLAGLEGMERLNLTNNAIADITAINSLENLKYLYLAKNGIDYLEPLRGLKLVELDLSDNNKRAGDDIYLEDIGPLVDVGFVDALWSLKIYFRLSSFLEFEGIEFMDELDGGGMLDLSGNKITEISALHDKKIQSLDLSENGITDAEIDAICASILRIDFRGILGKGILDLSNNAFSRINGLEDVGRRNDVVGENWPFKPFEGLYNLDALFLNNNDFVNIDYFDRKKWQNTRRAVGAERGSDDHVAHSIIYHLRQNGVFVKAAPQNGSGGGGAELIDGEIIGTVTAINDLPLAGVTVAAWPNPEGSVGIAEADKLYIASSAADGSFAMNISEPGYYTLEISGMGYIPYLISMIGFEEYGNGAVSLQSHELNAVLEMYGDVANIGSIDISSAIILMRYLAGIQELDDAAIKRAQVSGEAEPGIKDAILILRKVVGLIDEFPVEQ